MKIENVDLYITGSNSKMLSVGILTEFKDRGEEIKVFPLSYREFYDVFENKSQAWKEYFNYGGMPRLVSMKNHESKSKYLRDLFSKTYISDVIEKNNIRNEKEYLDDLLNILASSVGSLTNPKKYQTHLKALRTQLYILQQLQIILITLLMHLLFLDHIDIM